MKTINKTHLTIFFCIGVLFPLFPQTYLTVGDPAPKLEGCRWIKGDPIGTFVPGKMYVVVFGASWSATFLSSIPKLANFTEVHRNELQMITIFIHEQIGKGTTSYAEKVEQFVHQNADQFKGVVAIDNINATVQQAWQIDDMQQNALPWFMAIDREGKIAWSGNSLSTLENAINRIKRDTYSLQHEIDNANAERNTRTPFDYSKLHLANGNGGAGDEFAFRSLISRYDGKIAAPLQPFIQELTGIQIDSLIHAGRVQMIGAPLGMLYYTAYGDTLQNQVIGRNAVTNLFPDTVVKPHLRSLYGRWWHKPILEVSETSPFSFSWKAPFNRYSYSLQVPAALGTATFLKHCMQRDLMNYFGYAVTIEQRSMPYWKVSVSDPIKVKKHLLAKQRNKAMTFESDEDVLQFRNAIMRDIITMLGSFYGYATYDYGKMPPEEQGAFIDETGITESIDFDLNQKMSFADFRTYLLSKGIQISRNNKMMKVIVVRDPN